MTPRLLLFAAAVFLSALLLFQVQPLIGKYILPWYGGAQAVWTTCLLTFQSLLFAGYAYAHLIGRLGARAQAALHGGLLLVAALVPVVPREAWKPAGDENPLLRIVGMLLVTVGLPFFALSATGPLLQVWFWRLNPGRSPYPLYALSNAGSLIALLSYPFVVEPNLSGLQQAGLWRLGFFLFVLLGGTAAGLLWKSGAGGAGERVSEIDTPTEATGFGRRGRTLLWIGWSACGVMLFMATTNQMTLNVASVPFLWILPLSVYLLAFIAAFSGRRAYPRGLFAALFVAAIVTLCFLLQSHLSYDSRRELTLSIVQQVALYTAALFVLCLVCGGELFRLRPRPKRLTSFYLCISFGGALGGLVVGVLAPIFFLLYQELQLAMLLVCLLYLITVFCDRSSRFFWQRRRWAGALASLGILVLAGFLVAQARVLLKDSIHTGRSFFGVLRVTEVSKALPREHSRLLLDGAITHGHQLAHPDAQRLPTLYYARMTGIGHAMSLDEGRRRRIGIVGLGAGTLAAYGRPGDLFRFYEINPDVVDVARSYFTYLEHCEAEMEVVLGDARLTMEREEEQRYDILALDAFSSDAIPIHLLTLEALETYERHLAPDGLLALHVSNLNFDLAAMVFRLAESRGLQVLSVRNRYRPDRLAYDATWVFLARDAAALQALSNSLAPMIQSGDVEATRRAPDRSRGLRAWTDNSNDLFQVLR